MSFSRFDVYAESRLLFSKLNFQCAARTLVRIAGPNGTGKTSLLRLLVGLMQPQEGQILWKNEPIKKLKEEFWKDLVYIGHLNGVKDELTARENLLINCEIGEHPVTKEQADHALAMVGLEGFEITTRVTFLKVREDALHLPVFTLAATQDSGS